jgi:hypothetical protein
MTDARHDNRQAHMYYMWAIDELHRITGSGAFTHKRSRLGNDNSIFGWRAVTDPFMPYPLTEGAASYAHKLCSFIRSHRAGAKSGREYAPVAMATAQTVREVQKILTLMQGRKMKVVPDALCGSNVGVERRAGRVHVTVPATWIRRVKQAGLSTPDAVGKQCLTLRAKRMKSAFLEDDGITAYEATVFLPQDGGVGSDGYIFSASMGDRFCLFHTDFRLGANLIRRRVRNAVLDAMMGSGEK